MAVVALHPEQSLSLVELHSFLESRVSKWWLPDALEIVEAIPRTSVGKFSKLDLRKRFENYTLP